MLEKLWIIIQYIFFGAIQGITETLPISSSGHLVILNRLIGLKEPDNLTFEILLHLGSLIAVVYFYRKVLIELVVNFFGYLFSFIKILFLSIFKGSNGYSFKEQIKKIDDNKKIDFKYGWLIVLATIPAGFIGVLFNDFFEKQLTKLWTVGIALLFTALILFIIHRIERGNKDKKDITWLDALLIGLIQVIAITPGVSRSGSTVSMSLARKLNIENALRFSFLLFIPIALGAALIDFYEFFKAPDIPSELFVPYLLAFFTSILFTYISLNIFIDIIKRGKLIYFSIYCSILGTLAIILYFVL